MSTKYSKLVLVGMTGFMAENLLLSHYREPLVDKLGEDNFKNVYSVLSTLALSTCGIAILRGRGGPYINVSKFNKSIGSLFQLLGIAGLSQVFPKLQIPFQKQSNEELKLIPSDKDSNKTMIDVKDNNKNVKSSSGGYVARCPIDFKYEKTKKEVHGIERITRNPQLWSLGLYSFGVSLFTKSFPLRTLGYSMTIWCIIGSIHRDYRQKKGLSGSITPNKLATSSNIPFQALLENRQSWVMLNEEFKWVNANLAALFYLLIKAICRK